VVPPQDYSKLAILTSLHFVNLRSVEVLCITGEAREKQLLSRRFPLASHRPCRRCLRPSPHSRRHLTSAATSRALSNLPPLNRLLPRLHRSPHTRAYDAPPGSISAELTVSGAVSIDSGRIPAGLALPVAVGGLPSRHLLCQKYLIQSNKISRWTIVI
jgi:hypothetical protein